MHAVKFVILDDRPPQVDIDSRHYFVQNMFFPPQGPSFVRDVFLSPARSSRPSRIKARMRSHILSQMPLPLAWVTIGPVRQREHIPTPFRSSAVGLTGTTAVSNCVQADLQTFKVHAPPSVYLPSMQGHAFAQTCRSTGDSMCNGRVGLEHRRQCGIDG